MTLQKLLTVAIILLAYMSITVYQMVNAKSRKETRIVAAIAIITLLGALLIVNE